MLVHPVAEFFPMLPPAELESLADDIKKNGLRNPLVVQQGILLDGRNRLAACKIAGVEPAYNEYDGPDPVAFIVSVNIHRRHLNESQRATVAAKLTNMKHGGDRKSDQSANLRLDSVSQPKAAELLNVSRRTVQDAAMIQREAPELEEKIMAGKMTINAAKTEIKKQSAIKSIEKIKSQPTKNTDGLYDVIVIDPPWKIEKIIRDCRPNQVLLDYPTMSEDELLNLKIPFADACHVWLWSTHKHLPTAFGLVEAWGLKYVCCMVWHKPGGFQPVGLPQYNCEFALYCRKGSPVFVDTKAFPVCFTAPRGKHSEKPQEFYDLVSRVTTGRRLDMFNRRSIDGYDGWGNEAA